MSDTTSRHTKGQIAITTLLSVTSFVGSIAVPILWVTNSKQAEAVQNAVQDAKIGALEENFKTLKADTEYIRRSVEEQNRRQGISIKEN